MKESSKLRRDQALHRVAVSLSAFLLTVTLETKRDICSIYAASISH